MHPPLVLFAHGKESGPWGGKIRHLADIAQRHGAAVLSPDYSDLLSPADRVRRLEGLELPARSKLVLVGSSMGGFVSVAAAARLRPDGLFLMAPAVGMPTYPEPAPLPEPTPPLCLVLGWRDDVIPVDTGIEFARRHAAELHVLDDGHRLSASHEALGRIFEPFVAAILGEPT